MPVFDPNVFDGGVFDADGGLQRTATDTTSVSDSLAHSQVLTRAISDTTSVSDSPASSVGLFRALDDTTSVTDSIDHLEGTSRTAEDTVTTSDSLARQQGLLRAPADTTSLTEDPARLVALSRSPSDTTSVSDSIDHEVSTGDSFLREISDSVAVSGLDGAFQSDAFQTDAFQTGLASDYIEHTVHEANVTRTVTDTVITSDSIVSTFLGPERTVTDTVTTSDSIARSGTFTRTLEENLETIDFVLPYSVVDEVEGDIPTGYMPPLPAPIDDDDTTVPGMPPMGSTPDVPFVVIIDGEQWLVTNVAPDGTWTIVRGYNGTTATSHGAGARARPALARLTVGGVDVTADTHYGRSRWTTGANGQAGTAEIWVRDLERTTAFITGAEVILRFRGIRMWGGYVASVKREYVFSAGTGQVDQPRWLVLECVDYNVLFNKRLFVNLADPTNMAVRHWANGTPDSTVIGHLVSNYLTVSGDGLSYDIQHVGTPALPQISCNPDAPDDFGVGSAGWTWGQVMQSIASQTGAVYYIDPDKVFRYVDDSDKQSRFGWAGVSDVPNDTTTIGYRDVEFTSDGTRLTNDHLQWGAGQGSAELAFARVGDDASQATHGLWQTAERYDMYCQESIELRAETWIYGSPQNRRGGKDDRFFSRFTVREPYFRVADVISVASTEFDFSQTVPIRHAEITMPTPWDIKCILTAAHEIDAPWQTFEFWIPSFEFDFNFDLDIPEIPIPDPWGPFDPCAPLSTNQFVSVGEAMGMENVSLLIPSVNVTTSPSGLSWSKPVFKFQYGIHQTNGRIYINEANDVTSILDPPPSDQYWDGPGPPDTTHNVSIIDHHSGSTSRTLAVLNSQVGISSDKPGEWEMEWELWALWPDLPNVLSDDTLFEDDGEGLHPPGGFMLASSFSHGTLTSAAPNIKIGRNPPGVTADLSGCLAFYAPRGRAILMLKITDWTWLSPELGPPSGPHAIIYNAGTLENYDHVMFAVPPPDFWDDSPCEAAGPGGLANQPSGGTQTGEPLERDPVLTEDDSTIFYTEHQYQLGSTEVWVDGLRIRLGEDYLEYPRQAKIEVLSHIDVGGTGPMDPSKPVRGNYLIWTIDDPALE